MNQHRITFGLLGAGSSCKEFREQPGRREDTGRRIAESDLGSRIDDSNPLSSSRTYLPPKISLSRRQARHVVRRADSGEIRPHLFMARRRFCQHARGWE